METIELEKIKKRCESYGISIISFEDCTLSTEVAGHGSFMNVLKGTYRIKGRDLHVAFKQHRDLVGRRRALPDVIDQAMRQIYKEVELTKKLQYHPNIIQIYGITFQDTKPNLVVELAVDHLENYLLDRYHDKDPVSWYHKTILCLDVLWGVRGLSEAGIIHGDLKGSNVLVFENDTGAPRAKLSDFGNSSLVGSLQSTTGGTTIFLAPEKIGHNFAELSQWRKKPQQDIYGLGMVIFQVAADGKRPYADIDSIDDVIDAKVADKTSVSLLAQLSLTTPDEYRMIIQETTKFKPDERASLGHVEKQLRSALIKFAKQLPNAHDEIPTITDESVILDDEKEAKELLDMYTTPEGGKYVESGVIMDMDATLFLAAHHGHTKVIKLLRNEYKAKLDIKNIKGLTLILKAAQNGHIDTIKALVNDFGMNVKTPNNKGTNAIHYAAKNGHAKVIEMLVEEFKMDVNSEDIFGRTAIHYAAKYGRTDVIRVLVCNPEMDLNAQNSDGWTALHYAARHRFVSVVEILTKEGRVDVNMKDGSGQTAMYMAAKYGYVKVVQVLAENGADPNIGKWDGWTPLHVASSCGRIDIVQLLVEEFHADVNSKITAGSQNELTPLCVASKDEIVEILKAAIDKKGDETNTIDTVVAIVKNPVAEDVETARKLLETYLVARVADLSSTDTENKLLDETFFWAAGIGQNNVIKLLVKEYDVNVNIKDSTKGLTAMHFAARNGHTDTIKMLAGEFDAKVEMKNNKGANAMHYSAKNEHTITIKTFVTHFNMDPNAKDTLGRTALHYAAKNGNVEVVKFLTDLPTTEVSAVNNDGWTALHYAARYRHIDVIKVLTNRIKVNTIDSSGRTALYIAARQGNIEMVRVLYDLGGDVDIAKLDGWAPIHSASFHGNLEAILLLIELRANINNKITRGDKKGCTPLDIASSYNHTDVLTTIREAGGKPGKLRNPFHRFRHLVL